MISKVATTSVACFLLAGCSSAQDDRELIKAVGLKPPAAPAVCYRYPGTLKISDTDTSSLDEANEKARIVDSRERLADIRTICRRYMCELRPDRCQRKARRKKARTS